MENVHQSVLLNEIIDGLKFQKGDIFLDGTLGGGGHSAEVARRFGDDVKIIGIDLDEDAILRAEKVLAPLTKNFVLRVESFRNLDKVLDEIGERRVSKILFDLGLSSNQLELSKRGFSFQRDEPLLMTFGSDAKLTAKEVVNEWQEENLADIIYGFGGERLSRRIAKAIVEARKKQMIETTYQLVNIIKTAVPAWYQRSKIHFATRTFQAIRMAVNDELGTLKDGLEKGFERLVPGGRMAVVSFQSLEDRTVKQFFNNKSRVEELRLINKRVIRPVGEEIRFNPRARSAKLRLIEKLDENARIESKIK
jgi:16S rRNA (cytosine1402-N4)-methyltransferase